MDLIVPAIEDEFFPTLGDQVCDFLEGKNGWNGACFGPGDLKGRPLVLDDDRRFIIYRAYEVWPLGHPKAGRRRWKRIAVSVRKGFAKCLAFNTPVSMADGSVRVAAEIRAGDEIVGWDGVLRPARVVGVQEQLPAPMVRITTERGRVLEVTAEHPVLVRGTLWRPGAPKRRRYASCDPDRDRAQWTKADELAAGDRVVVGLGWSGTGDLSTEDAWLVGAFCGDGSGKGRFCSADQEIIDRIGARFTVTKCAGNNGYDHYVRGSGPLLRQHGMYDSNSRTKRVPLAVAKAQPESVVAFLAGYLDTDGWVSYTPLPSGKTRIAVAWGSVNRDLLADCQHLLAGIGINASLRSSVGTYQGRRNQAWELAVNDAEQAARLASMMLDHMAHRGKRSRAEALVNHVGRCVFGQRDTDRVVKVERLGPAPSIAVEVDDVHTHVTAGIVTHNTELMALIAYAELHPESPVRFNGFNRDGSLLQGRPVVDPYIPMLANAKLQVNELAYGALKYICDEGPDGDLFDASLERVVRLDGRGKADGKAVPLANAPDSNDGGRTTFQGFDETHRLYLPSERAAVTTMEANTGKRVAQDPWSMSTTTAGEPGQNSVAETDHFEAEAMARGEIKRPRMCYFHRQASDDWDMDKFEDRVEAIREASGPELAARTDIEDLASQWDIPGADKPYLERVWTNRWTQQGLQAFNLGLWKTLARPEARIPRGAYVTVGFDGARFRDATALVVTEVKTGLQQLEFLAEKPLNDDDWEVDETALTAKWNYIRRSYKVLLCYGDPAYYTATLGAWAAKAGVSPITKNSVVQEFWTNKQDRMVKALLGYESAINSSLVTYSDVEYATGEPTKHGDLTRHIGNAGKKLLNMVDLQTGKRKWILGKLHKDRKFDAGMAAVLSWEARMDVLPLLPKPRKRVFKQIR